MREYKEVTSPHLVLKDVMCDVCGVSCVDSVDVNYEYAELAANWGYGSGKDGIRWECIMCETCADKVKSFIESIGGGIREEEY